MAKKLILTVKEVLDKESLVKTLASSERTLAQGVYLDKLLKQIVPVIRVYRTKLNSIYERHLIIEGKNIAKNEDGTFKVKEGHKYEDFKNELDTYLRSEATLKFKPIPIKAFGDMKLNSQDPTIFNQISEFFDL